MTVCAGLPEPFYPFVIISILVPSLVIYFINKYWKIKNKYLQIGLYILIFIVLSLALIVLAAYLFTPPCLGMMDRIPPSS